MSRQTLGRWRRLYESGGFDALVPSPRQCQPRTPAEVLALAEALKREKPGRTAAQVRRILQLTSGWAPSDRTLQRLFERLELTRSRPRREEQRAFGRFECARPNEMWTGDTLHGPVIAGGEEPTCSRSSTTIPVRSWEPGGPITTTWSGWRRRSAPPCSGAASRSAIYLDNGSAFVDAWLLRGCAVLGIRLIHSRPGKPEGQGEDRAVLVRHEARGRIPGIAGRNSEGGSWV